MQRVLPSIKVGIEESRIWIALAIALTALSLLPIWLVKFPPLEDYPYHLVRVHIIANYSNPSFNYNEFLTVSFFPIPYILVDYLLLMLTWLFPIQVAGKIFLSIYVVLLPWSTFYFVRSVDTSKTILGFFGFLFIYSRYFNKGFISFVFSVPLFLFAVGYWWRIKNEPTWKRQLLLSGLILCVYLSHIFSYAILLYTFVLLAMLSFRDVRKVLQTLIPFLPSLILFGGAFAYQLPNHVETGDPVVLFYTSLLKKIWSTKGYFLSFWSDQERVIVFIAAVVALALLIYNKRALKQNVFFALLLMLALTYLLLPTDITRYLSFSCRVLIFMVFIGLPLLAVPKTALFRSVVVLIVVTLSVFYLVVTLMNYQFANQGLQNCYAAIEHIPGGKRVLFKTEKKLIRVARFASFDRLGAYYYIEKGGTDLGALERQAFIGTFRSVQSKDNQPIDHASKAARVAGPLENRTDRGDYAVFLSEGENSEIVRLTDELGYKPVLTVGSVVFYQRERVPSEAQTGTITDTISIARSQEYDYLLLYWDLSRTEPTIESDFERVFSQGYAHVFKRRTSMSETE